MTNVLQVKDQNITPDKVVPLLANYQMLPQFLREIIIDQAIASVPLALEEEQNACQQFYQKHQLTSDIEKKELCELYGMNLEELESLAMRKQRIEKFKRVTWEHKLESYFLSRKPDLDKVIYSLIQVENMNVANELYFRIQEGEKSFSEVVQEYSQSAEAETGGLLGPVELGKIPSPLAQMLRISQSNQLWTPTRVGKLVSIVRLEKMIPAQLDQTMRHRLLDELFKVWLQEEFTKLMNDGLISLSCR